MVVLVAELLGYLWVTGRKLGRLLNDQTLLSFPVVAILSALTVIAERAQAMGLEWSAFFGPIRPARRWGESRRRAIPNGGIWREPSIRRSALSSLASA